MNQLLDTVVHCSSVTSDLCRPTPGRIVSRESGLEDCRAEYQIIAMSSPATSKATLHNTADYSLAIAARIVLSSCLRFAVAWTASTGCQNYPSTWVGKVNCTTGHTALLVKSILTITSTTISKSRINVYPPQASPLTRRPRLGDTSRASVHI